MTENLRLVGQRLKTFMQTRGLSITGLARMTKFSAKELDAIIDGKAYPISQLMHLLALFDDLNPSWLLHGEGAMLLRGAIPAKRELDADIEARETLRRHAKAASGADKLGERVQALEAELTTVRELAAALAARLDRLEK